MKREAKKQGTRNKLVETALRLFATQGYEATTVARITAEAGVAKGTFFNYFQSKEDVLLQVSDVQQSWTVEQLAGLAAAPSPLAPRLAGLMEQLASRLLFTPALVRAMFRTTMARVGEDRVAADLAAALEPLFARGQENGEFTRRLSPRVLAEVAVQTYFGALLRWTGDRPLAALVAESFDALLYGVVQRPVE